MFENLMDGLFIVSYIILSILIISFPVMMYLDYQFNKIEKAALDSDQVKKTTYNNYNTKKGDV